MTYGVKCEILKFFTVAWAPTNIDSTARILIEDYIGVGQSSGHPYLAD